MTATFAEQADRTEVTFRMLFETAAECDKVKAYAVQGNEQNFGEVSRG